MASSQVHRLSEVDMTVHGKERVGVVCSCNQYESPKTILETLKSLGHLVTVYSDVVHCEVGLPWSGPGDAPPFEDKEGGPNRSRGDAFFFPYGCSVFWGLTEGLENHFLLALSHLEQQPLSVHERECDDLLFCYGGSSSVAKDLITLGTLTVEEKLASSFALAQSVRLSAFEEAVDKIILKTRHLPESLATDGKIHMSKKEISKLIGELFIERSQVNLYSDMLDTPEFFWESDEYESVYKNSSKYLSIGKRVDILNRRLSIIKELYDMLYMELSSQHDSRLEWIIIVLLAVEVAVEVFWNILVKDVLKLV